MFRIVCIAKQLMELIFYYLCVFFVGSCFVRRIISAWENALTVEADIMMVLWPSVCQTLYILYVSTWWKIYFPIFTYSIAIELSTHRIGFSLSPSLSLSRLFLLGGRLNALNVCVGPIYVSASVCHHAKSFISRCTDSNSNGEQRPTHNLAINRFDKSQLIASNVKWSSDKTEHARTLKSSSLLWAWHGNEPTTQTATPPNALSTHSIAIMRNQPSTTTWQWTTSTLQNAVTGEEQRKKKLLYHNI